MRIDVHHMSAELARDCMPILEMNHMESGRFPEEDFSPDMQGFIDLEESFIAFILYDEQDRIIGLSFFVMMMDAHINYLMTADQLTFYVVPDHRKYALLLLNHTEKWFKENHIDIIQQGAIAGSRFQKLLELRGYHAGDVTMIKRLT